jgi:hypothetical protein
LVITSAINGTYTSSAYSTAISYVTAADTYWSNVALLLQFDTASGTAPTTDVSGKRTLTWTNCQVLANGSTGASGFTPSSGPFTGSGNMLGPNTTGGLSTTSLTAGGFHYYLTTDSGVSFGTSDFTIEFWYYYVGGTVVGADPRMMSNWTGGGFGANSWIIAPPTATGFGLQTANGFNGRLTGTAYGSPYNLSSTSWNHFAMSRSGGSFWLYLNGVMKLSTTWSSTNSMDGGTSRPVVVASFPGDPAYSNGFFDEIRITIGTDRYKGANFSVQSSPYPNHS